MIACHLIVTSKNSFCQKRHSYCKFIIVLAHLPNQNNVLGNDRGKILYIELHLSIILEGRAGADVGYVQSVA
jgi:hypothetical protein